ncbi:hypothetical protein BCR44DRAFT_1428721 [Catenaria anguillulae PL171]|uniref:Secreted protein n=1 Tax=Catenaria anguillulae PL171 TaxID=765915 RepID=A0A1Y2HVX4_9FUNG|nr:hypothetical protein BCR44DRAFT_1428721 [Catenaria anguillulae PL171]
MCARRTAPCLAMALQVWAVVVAETRGRAVATTSRIAVGPGMAPADVAAVRAAVVGMIGTRVLPPRLPRPVATIGVRLRAGTIGARQPVATTGPLATLVAVTGPLATLVEVTGPRATLPPLLRLRPQPRLLLQL